ncbi:hypothetical protein AOA12_18725 [Microbacterium sp. No. 7]|nr:hypothetical protein AOA12_18725 [Microbacterium sp. No. 7]
MRMNEFEQNLLFAAVTLMLVTTLVVFVVQYVRGRGRGDDD